jgi:uncharacterized membrane protein
MFLISIKIKGGWFPMPCQIFYAEIWLLSIMDTSKSKYMINVMKTNNYFSLYLLIFGGVLFSGYLSATKLLTNTCAFNESCPYVFGYPACYYGFTIFFLMLIFSVVNYANTISNRTYTNVIKLLSFVGILFSGNLVIREIINGSVTGSLGLSTCAYGLGFYVIIFIVSLKTKNNVLQKTTST